MNDPWTLAYEGYDPDREGLRETLCTLGNGYFCTRGAAPDSLADGVHYPGTYLAGGYDRLATKIQDRTVENEDLVNLPNWLVLAIRLGDEDWLRPDELEFLEYRQELSLDQGLLIRSLRFRDPKGRTLRWQERRFVSMADPHLGALAVCLTVEDWSGRLTVRSALDGSVVNAGVARYRDLAGNHLETLDRGAQDAETILLRSRTVQSRRVVAEAARTRLYRDGRAVVAERRTESLPDFVAQDLSFDLDAGATVVVEKLAALFESRDPAISEPGLAAVRAVGEAGTFDDLLAAHRLAWRHLWEGCDLGLEAQDSGSANLKLRLHIFHLLQTVSQHGVERDAGVPPRGWHGEAYRGHIMWDELFIFPFLNLRLPVLARALLRYRYRRLPAARALAQAAGYRGALYPWQSGSSGREESQVLHLNPQSGRWIPDNSHRQRHINSAIAYNVWSYYEVTGDRQFLYEYGAEMLVEIARFWASIATYDPQRGRYDIKGVMGPDEFHTAYPGVDPSEAGGLDNNAYTNVMAAWVLNRACDALDLLPCDRARRLRERLALSRAEEEDWHDIGRRLYVPFHGDGIISQFEGYEALEEFDWEGCRERHGDIQRLDRILEAEGDTPNRYKVSKQADVLMLFYLFSADELTQLFEQLGYAFEPRAIPRTVDYYLARTSHGSTLSRIVHSWVLARSKRARSWQLFLDALDSDVADIQGGTTAEGIHLGAMAGTVDLVQRGYLGVETRGGVLHLNPVLPDRLRKLTVRIRYRQQELDLEATPDRLRVSSRQLTAAPITIAYRGRFRELGPGGSYEFRLIDPALHGGGADTGDRLDAPALATREEAR